MNIISLIIKEIKHNFRNRKAMTMMVLFPIVLIVVLGAALSKNFSDTNSIPKAEVLYTNEASGQLGESFKASIIDKGKELNINFTEIKDPKKAQEEISNYNKYNCYLRLTDKNVIELYKNDTYNLSSSLVESILNVYIEKFNTLSEIAKVNPMSLKEIANNNKADFSQVVSLDKKRKPTSKDYYAITMLTLIIMYSSLTGMYGVNGEKSKKTGNRMLCAPVDRYAILTGKTLGGVFVTILQIAIVILFSKYALKTYWGENIVSVFIIIISQIIMAISLGASIAFIINDENAAAGILNFLIPLFVFFGGGYIPLDTFGNKFINTVANFSPVHWVNDSIFRIIYSNDFSEMPHAIIINLALAGIFIISSAVLYRREAQ